MSESSTRADVLLVCSSGGHLLQLTALRGAWGDLSRVWVTFDKADARSLLEGERVVYAYGPTNRSLKNLVRNAGVAWRVVRSVRPSAIVTTGAGVAVPFAWAGRLRRIPVVYIESFTRIEEPSLSLRLIRPAAQRVYVQWPELAHRVRGARYVGSILGAPR